MNAQELTPGVDMSRAQRVRRGLRQIAAVTRRAREMLRGAHLSRGDPDEGFPENGPPQTDLSGAYLSLAQLCAVYLAQTELIEADTPEHN